MAQLFVKDPGDAVVDASERRAAANARSTEASDSDKLQRATRPVHRTFKEALAQMPYFDDDQLFDMR